jgi:hypothetical protein
MHPTYIYLIPLLYAYFFANIYTIQDKVQLNIEKDNGAYLFIFYVTCIYLLPHLYTYFFTNSIQDKVQLNIEKDNEACIFLYLLGDELRRIEREEEINTHDLIFENNEEQEVSDGEYVYLQQEMVR